MQAAADDHFLAYVVLHGRFGFEVVRPAAFPCVTLKRVQAATAESQAEFWKQLSSIPVLSWGVDVHEHKYLRTCAMHQAAQCLEPAAIVKKKPYAKDSVLASAREREWHLHQKTCKANLAKRYCLQRFIQAWLHKAEPELHLDHILPVVEVRLRCGVAQSVIALLRSPAPHLTKVAQAKVIYLQEKRREVAKAGGNVWKAVECFRNGNRKGSAFSRASSWGA